MPLQPTFRFGPTRGRSRRVPTTVEESASMSNDSAYARQAAQNQLALNSTPNLGVTNVDHEEPTRQALARALGYKEGEVTPSIGQLMLRFQGLSPAVKAGIYKAGGAQFIAPEDAAEMASKQTDILEKVHDQHTNDVVQAMTAGKIEPVKGKDGKITWMVNQEQDIDPSNPILGKRKVQVAANPVIVGYIDRAQKKGFIPNPETGLFPETGNLPLSKQDIQRRMSSEEFQGVLNARARGEIAPDALSAPKLAANLATTKISTGDMMGPPMPSTTLPTGGYIPSGRAAQDLGINAEAATNAVVDTASGALNVFPRAWNYLAQKKDQATRFLFGSDVPSTPQSGLIDRSEQQPLNPQDASSASDIAYFLARKKKLADETGGIGY